MKQVRLLIIMVSTLVFGLFMFPLDASSETSKRRFSAEFQIKLLDGTVVNASDIQGKIAVLDFWGTWCKPCLEEIPDYNNFYLKYKDKGVTLIALAADSGSEEKVRRASERLKIGYPVSAPSRKELKAFGKIRSYPTTWVINPSGEIEIEFVGVVADKQKVIREIVDQLIDNSSALQQSP